MRVLRQQEGSMTRDLSICEKFVSGDLSPAWRRVSLLGLGTVKFGRNQKLKYPAGDGFAMPADAEIEFLLDLALECGINLLDTAPAYGSSEERLGKLMGARRGKFFLVTKTGEEFCNGKSEHVFTAEHTRMSVERSLQRLNTDFLDCVLVHSNSDDVNVIANSAALETLSRLKDQGKIGSIGVSTHTVEGGKLAVDLSDCVMVSYNKNHTAERLVIDHARTKGRAVLVKKGLVSGHIGTPGEAADHIRFVTRTPGVTSLVFGSITPENIRANVRAVTA
jgi:aryl-alcohol dehydrogenase-like predicted oxidoreductase